MKVNLGSIEVTDDERRAIKRWQNERGMATRDDCRALVYQWVAVLLEEISKEVSTLPPLPRKRRGSK